MGQAPDVDRTMGLEEFAVELEALDPAKLQARPRALHQTRPTSPFAEVTFSPVPVEARKSGMKVFPYDAAPESKPGASSTTSRSRRSLIAALLFLGLMLVGGGAAAAVFHSRIELLLQ